VENGNDIQPRYRHPGLIIREKLVDYLGFSITQIADLLKISKSHLSNFFNGKSALTPNLALRIARVFNMRASELMGMQICYDLDKASIALHFDPNKPKKFIKTKSQIKFIVPENIIPELNYTGFYMPENQNLPAEFNEQPEELYEHHRFRVDRGQTLIRIDKYLVNSMSSVSRNRIQEAAEAGNILVNNNPVRSNYRVKSNDVITILLDYPPTDYTVEPEDIPFDIVYEDSEILIVNKPAGMVVHPGVGNFEHTLLNAVAWHLRDDPFFDPNNPHVGLVHRIDKDTSGLLILAKTETAKSNLGMQFYKKTTKRQYFALVWGNVKDDEGTVVGALARDTRDRMCYRVYDQEENPKAKYAVTHYKTVERFGYVTLVQCQLETGRTHQIRVHMKHIGHTLFNDERYGGNEILKGNRTAKYRQFVENCFAICPRQALHARTLGIKHPRTGEDMFFEVAPPEDMQKLIEKWRNFANNQLQNQQVN
jgi:23S rRNA pseudouridine1911/1915/1917 synthase